MALVQVPSQVFEALDGSIGAGRVRAGGARSIAGAPVVLSVIVSREKGAVLPNGVIVVKSPTGDGRSPLGARPSGANFVGGPCVSTSAVRMLVSAEVRAVIVGRGARTRSSGEGISGVLEGPKRVFIEVVTANPCP